MQIAPPAAKICPWEALRRFGRVGRVRSRLRCCTGFPVLPRPIGEDAARAPPKGTVDGESGRHRPSRPRRRFNDSEGSENLPTLA